jgi:molybdopterin/thiamine biosynthesis adenylyltransferase
MKAKFNALSNYLKVNALVSEPLFFRLNKENEKKELDALLAATPGIIVHDEILAQVEEYVKATHPARVFTKDELTKAAIQHMGDVAAEEYGVWVYYPWSEKLVHLLDETEFVEVRTNRNQYKITPPEKELLSKKKIGVIGLSVGQSIALTIAMERLCGELRIADFDVIELSNLNRIRTGVHNLGLAKTVAVAREIKEMDPFFKVTCYHEGITNQNLDDFLTKDGKLDILVDECDSLDIKIRCRLVARENKIPVIMDTSDRGMLDIERFDLEPSRPILHGLIDHLDINKVSEAKTNEEKIPFVMAILSVDTISKRMKYSMGEVRKTITTWPQLASSVVMGGGLSADTCRRILLDEFHDSGRYFIDTEELMADRKK